MIILSAPCARHAASLRRTMVVQAMLLCSAVPLAAQQPTPDGVRIETGDVARFIETMEAMRDAATAQDSLRILTESYFGRGSTGLEAFTRARIESPAELMAVMKARPRYYRHLARSLAGVGEAEPAIREAFRRFEEIYPQAVYADVYIVVGRMNSGGTTAPARILLGAEMYGRDTDAPTDELSTWARTVVRDTSVLATIAVHELMHINQRGDGSTLLGQALGEGGADFVTELVTGRNINSHVHAWADPRETELWAEFQTVMCGESSAGWLYDSSRKDRPADLGYWMGYKIASAYYERATDKRRAIAEILDAATDPFGFLERSGYAPAQR